MSLLHHQFELLYFVQALRPGLRRLCRGCRLGRFRGLRLGKLTFLHRLLPCLQLIKLSVIALAAENAAARGSRNVGVHPCWRLVLLAILPVFLIFHASTVTSVTPATTLAALRLGLAVFCVPPVLVAVTATRHVIVACAVWSWPPIAAVTTTLQITAIATPFPVTITVAARCDTFVPPAIVPPVSFVVFAVPLAVAVPITVPVSTRLVAVLAAVIALAVTVTAPTIPVSVRVSVSVSAFLAAG